MKISVTKGKGSFHKKLKQLKDLGKQSVEVGHFAEQGTHHSSGMSYVDLMKFHETGGVGAGGVISPPRPVRALMLSYGVKATMTGGFALDTFKKWSEGLLDNDGFFRGIGVHLGYTEKSMFGLGGPLLRNAPYTAELKGEDNPLIETGDLVAHVAYKTSLSKGVVNV